MNKSQTLLNKLQNVSESSGHDVSHVEVMDNDPEELAEWGNIEKMSSTT